MDFWLIFFPILRKEYLVYIALQYTGKAEKNGFGSYM